MKQGGQVVAEARPQQREKRRGERRENRNFLIYFQLGEGCAQRVKQVTRIAGHVASAIAAIAEHREADALQVSPDLVRSAGYRKYCQKRTSVCLEDGLVPS